MGDVHCENFGSVWWVSSAAIFFGFFRHKSLDAPSLWMESKHQVLLFFLDRNEKKTDAIKFFRL